MKQLDAERRSIVGSAPARVHLRPTRAAQSHCRAGLGQKVTLECNAQRPSACFQSALVRTSLQRSRCRQGRRSMSTDSRLLKELVPHPEEVGFLREFLADPKDGNTKLVYADWLEERGDPRGEFLRLRCNLADQPHGGLRYKELASRERALRAVLNTEWMSLFSPMLVSGSVLTTRPRAQVTRFLQICTEIGRALARYGYGVVGCEPDPSGSRLIAAQIAQEALHSANPKSVFTSGGMQFLNLDNGMYLPDREKFLCLASGAIFIGGGSGTREEFEWCKANSVRPLIPVAGAGGAGAELAQHLHRTNPEAIWDSGFDQSELSELANPDLPAEAYAAAVIRVLLPPKFYKQTKAWWKFW